MGKLLWRFLKAFWFPILLIVLRLMGKKHPWADKTHSVLKKAR
jgi:hypothetical protein